MDKSGFKNIMSYLVSAYPSANISGSTAKVYYEHLKDIPVEIVEKAVLKIVQSSHFFPSVAEIREGCLKEERPEIYCNPVEAIEILNNSISKFGRYRTQEALEYIKAQDAVLYQIVKAIRFVNLCNSDISRYRTEIEILYKTASEDLKKAALITSTTVSEMIQLSRKIEHEAFALKNNDF